VLLAGAAAVVVVLTPFWGRNLAYFRVREVQVRGTKYAQQSEIAARLGIDTTYSIWRSLEPLERRVEKHPLVRSAEIQRSLPGKLVVSVDERVPVALVSTSSGLRAYDADGRALPMDLSRRVPDVPVIDRADTTVLRLLADLRQRFAETFAQVSEVRGAGKAELRIQLMDVGVLAMRGVSADRLAELSSVQRDLADRGLAAMELDLRFTDQVIARLP
jgi:cell division protein FtsQ